MNIEKLVNQQRRYFLSGKTLSYEARMQALTKLEHALNKYNGALEEALYADLHKSKMESDMAEIGLTRSERSYCKKHLRQWMAREHVHTDLANFSATSFTIAEPYGVTLVMAPWNYPVLLCLEPVINALAAGNTVILKPSAYAPHVSAVLAEMIGKNFSKAQAAVVEGGRAENQELLEQRFDYIFFTGGVNVGRMVLEKASRFMTPVTLELGGKSPCIVDKTANLKLAARRIIFGKILNSGETCVAPDYLLVAPEVKEELFMYMKRDLKKMLGDQPLENPDYPRMVNQKHYDRVMSLIHGSSEARVIVGGYGNENTLQIAPTILDGVSFDSPIMNEEIFGPVLPVMCFHSKEELLQMIRHFEKPLACYLFTNDKAMESWALRHISFGGGCINDTIVHLATSRMGFGGVGYSGMGSYHGKVGFETFSHRKSVLKKHQWLDVPVRYHPYNKIKEIMVKFLL
ncbi:MAG: aldehyde dehydrogenase [Lachnospira sp.]|nr:aldehyde dehydrogenase [Lachnospira sp.]